MIRQRVSASCTVKREQAFGKDAHCARSHTRDLRYFNPRLPSMTLHGQCLFTLARVSPRGEPSQGGQVW